jgi:hypothetical protein
MKSFRKRSFGGVRLCGINFKQQTHKTKELKMKKTFTIIALISTIIATSLNAQDVQNRLDRSPEGLADTLISAYDWDKSGALDQLEMCAAVGYLQVKRPFTVFSDPVLSRAPEPVSTPKVAVTLVDNFDLDENYQLEHEELAMAIT